MRVINKCIKYEITKCIKYDNKCINIPKYR